MISRKTITRLLFCTMAAALACGTGFADDISGYTEMEKSRESFVKWLEEDQSGMEFRTHSNPLEGGAETNIEFMIPGIELSEAGTVLTGPEAWCEVLFLHMNVKACVYGESDSGQWIKMYMGRKYYQSAKKAEQIELEFNSGSNEDGVKWVSLTADEGPYNTSDYFIGLSAIEAENGIYAQLRSSQKAGSAVSSAMDLYFATLAKNKVGFSVVGTHHDGEPKYAGGAQGMLERNVVRYLLALGVYMQTYEIAGLKGLRVRAEKWYDATEHYAEQLHEVDRDDYLEDKEKEYKQQLEMQAEAN